MKKNTSLYLVLLLGLIVAPFVGAYPIFVMKLLCFAIFAAGFNVLIGFAGLVSFGHAAYFGGSAYVMGYMVKGWGLPPELSLIIGTAFGALLGALFGGLAIRRHGIYFAMITLALAQIIYFVALQAPFTGGEDGMQGIRRGTLFGFLDLSRDINMYYVTLAIAVAAFLLIWRIAHSPFGQLLKAIKGNEQRTISLGYDVSRLKLLAFVISAAMAGLAGSLKALVLGFATLSDVHWTASGQVVLMTLLGGIGTMSGPLLGALLVVVLENKIGVFGNMLAQATSIQWFRAMGDSIPMVMGFIFVVCVLTFRRGIMGELGVLWKKWQSKSDHNTALSTGVPKPRRASPEP